MSARPEWLGEGYGWCPIHHAWRLALSKRCPLCERADAENLKTPEKQIQMPRSGGFRCTVSPAHRHDSKGEACACPGVYAEAAANGQTVFRPGKPGVPIFRLAPDESGRPVYVSADWILVDSQTHAVAAVIDYKGARQVHGKRRDIAHGGAWTRGRRCLETEYGVRVREIER